MTAKATNTMLEKKEEEPNTRVSLKAL